MRRVQLMSKRSLSVLYKRSSSTEANTSNIFENDNRDEDNGTKIILVHIIDIKAEIMFITKISPTHSSSLSSSSS